MSCTRTNTMKLAPLSLALALVAPTAAAAQDVEPTVARLLNQVGARQTDPEDRMHLPYDSEFQLGTGIRPENGTSYATPFEYEEDASPQRVEVIGTTFERSASFSTQASRAEFIDLSMGVDVKGWGQSLSASADWNERQEFKSTYASFGVHKWTVKDELRFDPNQQSLYKLSPIAEAKLKDSPRAFIEAYGPYMVAGHKRGCAFDGRVNVHASSTHAASELSASLEGSWKAFGVKASFAADLERTVSSGETTERVETDYLVVGYDDPDGTDNITSDPYDIGKMMARAETSWNERASVLAAVTSSWLSVQKINNILLEQGSRDEFIRQMDLSRVHLEIMEQKHSIQRILFEAERAEQTGQHVGSRLPQLIADLNEYLDELESMSNDDDVGPGDVPDRTQEFLDRLNGLSAEDVEVLVCVTAHGSEDCHTETLRAGESWQSGQYFSDDDELRFGATYDKYGVRALLHWDRADGYSENVLGQPLENVLSDTSSASAAGHTLTVSFQPVGENAFYSPTLDGGSFVGDAVRDLCGGRNAILKVSSANITVSTDTTADSHPYFKLRGSLAEAEDNLSAQFQILELRDTDTYVFKLASEGRTMHAFGSAGRGPRDIRLHGRLPYAQSHANSQVRIVPNGDGYSLVVRQDGYRVGTTDTGSLNGAQLITTNAGDGLAFDLVCVER